jgi:hypothetical protein
MSQVVEEITLEDLDVYWANNGLPIFLANREDICDVVENMGFSIYYLLGNLSKVSNTSSTNPTTKAVTNTQTVNSTMQLFKVVNNFVGRSVSAANEPFDSLFISIEEQALYTMPAIPHVIIDKLDQFFRLVDAQHGTESIVMLTYDITKEGPEGWGVLVPDQVNTSVHCNYDPDSVATVKPDDVMIVGSVHSHPGMSAYASGTDHKDQADFDGIHITFGWQKSVNNGATQYHIELQMSGKAYTLKPEDVFEDYSVDKAPDPEVVDWSTKVKKVLPPNMGGYSTNTPQHQPYSGKTHTPHGAKSNTTAPVIPNKEQRLWGFEEVRKQFESSGLFDVEPNAIIIAEIDSIEDKEVVCPSCATVLDAFNFFNGYCDFCYIPIVEPHASIEMILRNLSNFCQDLYIDTHVPVYLWSVEESGTHSLMKIVETTLNAKMNETYKDDEDIIISSLDDENVYEDGSHYYLPKDVTLCCGEKLGNGLATCSCEIAITADDVLHFDSVTRYIHMYTKESACTNCEFFYEYRCPFYQKAVHSYFTDPDMDVSTLERSIDINDCSMYEPYRTNTVMSGWDDYE